MRINSQEEKVFSILREVAEENEVTCRVAGGWVRDQVLEIDSHDIDITVDIMSGKAFAGLVAKKIGGKVSVIEANVEANKNLESAILRIEGMDVDFAQLRSEEYNEETRNPEIRVGVSAKEDAYRRDLTINGLFYNLHTGEIEDYVRGLEHLKAKIVCTPRRSIDTFLEDPLRIFRAIRFAARFGFELSGEICYAARDPRVISALTKKISRERIWTEFSKFMGSSGFNQAVLYMEDSGMRDLFLAPNEVQMGAAEKKSKGTKWTGGFDGWDKDQNNPHHNLDVWDHTCEALNWLHENCDRDNLVRNLALLLHDVGKCDICSQQVHPEGGWVTYHEHEISSALAADEILKGLKAPVEIRERVVRLVRNHMRLHTMPLNAKAGLRRVIRDIGDDWDNLVEMSKADSMGKVNATLDEKYDKFAEYAKDFRERYGNEVKPPINGHEVMSILGLEPGKQVGYVMGRLRERLLDEPEMSRDEAISYIRRL